MQFPTDPSELAEAISMPLERWPGNCHGVAEAILRRAPIRGMRLVRGHYTGWVSRDSVYGGGRGLQQHSWLRLEDGRILDPTRWAMVSPNRPFIYVGEADEYDEAGLCAAQRGRPAMAMSLFLSGKAGEMGERISERLNHRTDDQRGALALAAGMPEIAQAPVPAGAAERLIALLQDPVEHHEDPEGLYGAAADAGLKAMIRIDCWIRVMEPERVTPDVGTNFFYEAPPADEMTDMQRLFKVFARFLSIEERELNIEKELAEYGYELGDLHDALNGMERRLRHQPDLPWMESGHRDLLCVVASDLLGKGFGEVLRVESYADSLGLDRAGLHRAMVEFSKPAGFDLVWLIGDEAKRAMISTATEIAPGLA